ncbi:hypothetical protein HC891_11080 [Candidatus Gracilibacteria bacterium]|nr:hypothetical protein [Candidatus Gracilibacteria bacterium]
MRARLSLLRSALAIAFTFAIVALSLSPAFTRDVVHAAPSAPRATLNIPNEVFIGENFSFTVAFDNIDSTDAGYGPFIDLIIPVLGADGAGAAVDDGITFINATYLGSPVLTQQIVFDADGCVDHPYVKDTSGAPVQVCGTPGDRLVVLQLPFGSFTPTQPEATIVVNASLSNQADLNTPLTIRARAGFQFGNDTLANPCCDPPITFPPPTITASATWPGDTLTPILLKLTKTYIGPEDETVTGPNFPRQYLISADIADGQTVTNLVLTDTLPIDMQYVRVDATRINGANTAASAVVSPSTTVPGGTLARRFTSVTGTTAADNAEMLFTFYVPRLDAASADVLDPISGDDVLADNNASLGASWDPIDPRDPIAVPSIDVSGFEHRLEEQSIAIQKASYVASALPNATIVYTLNVQISDFFAFNTVVISDTFSDGQRFDTSFTPTMQVAGNSFTLPTAAFADANYTVSQNFTAATAAPPVFTIDPATNDGKTTVTFRVSDEILLRDPASLGRMLGGCVEDDGTGLVSPCDPLNVGDGPTTAQVIFRTVIQDIYSDDFPSGDASVDQGDVLNNNVTVSGNLLNNTGLAQNGQSEADDSAVEIEIQRGSLAKSIYAINGIVNTYTNAVEVAPGDTVTYRLVYQLPASDVEDLALIDYLPLPVFDVDETAAISTTFDTTVSATAPPAGSAKYGPTDTFSTLPGTLDPTVNRDSIANSISFSYGDYDNGSNVASVIDILFTVTVDNDPFADRLLLTNQVRQTEESTQQVDEFADSIIQVTLTEPFLRISKGVIGANNPNATLTPSAGPVTFSALVPPAARFAGTINSTNLITNPINANISGVDAGDLVSFAMMIENIGSSAKGAFDVTITDTIPLGFVIPSTGAGLNLRVTRGDGVVVPFSGLGGGNAAVEDDLFFSGIELTDPSAMLGVCQRYHPTDGSNIIIITYDLQLADNVKPGDVLTNIANITKYAGTEGGPNHVPDPRSRPSDTASASVLAPLTKSIDATSEASTSEAGVGTNANPRLVAIGEIVRYRLMAQLPEGQALNLQLLDLIPTGVTFLDDNTATVAFVSNSGTITSTTLSGAGLNQTGNQTTTTTLEPTFLLPDAAISESATADVDSYTPNDDVFFKLGDVFNSDRDSDFEYVIVEFNALVNNVTDNQAGTSRDNSFALRLGSTTVSSSNSTRVRVVEPNIGIAKLVSQPPPMRDTVTIRCLSPIRSVPTPAPPSTRCGPTPCLPI